MCKAYMVIGKRDQRCDMIEQEKGKDYFNIGEKNREIENINKQINQ